VDIHHEVRPTVCLEEEASADREGACVVPLHQAGKEDEVDLCVAVLVEWALVLWDEVLLLQATTISVKVLMAKALRRGSSRRTVRVIGAYLHRLLWR
jgi:hypothetical protein